MWGNRGFTTASSSSNVQPFLLRLDRLMESGLFKAKFDGNLLTISKITAETTSGLLSVDTEEYSCGDKQALETFNIDAHCMLRWRHLRLQCCRRNRSSFWVMWHMTGEKIQVSRRFVAVFSTGLRPGFRPRFRLDRLKRVLQVPETACARNYVRRDVDH